MSCLPHAVCLYFTTNMRLSPSLSILAGCVLLFMVGGLGVGMIYARQKSSHSTPAVVRPVQTSQGVMLPREKGNSGKSVTEDSHFNWTDGKCMGQGPAVFTFPPMRVQDIGYILPMGLLADGHVTPSDHQYYSPKVFDSPPDAYDVMAPADGDIVSIQHRGFFVGDHTPAGKEQTSEYRVFIEHSCTFWTYYDLITRLSPDIEALVGDLTKQPFHGRIPVKAGQVIGKIGGQTLDVGVVNSEVTLSGLLLPDQYVYEPWKIHAADPFDYFIEPLRSELLTKNVRQAEPRGGKIDYDVDGKLVGNWFLQGTNGYAGSDRSRYWAGHLSFVYDYLDPSQIRVSIGTFGDRARQFGVQGNGPDPAQVDPRTGIVKYVLMMYQYIDPVTGKPWNRKETGVKEVISRNIEGRVSGVLLVQMTGERTVKVEAFPDVRPESVTGFTDKAQVYER